MTDRNVRPMKPRGLLVSSAAPESSGTPLDAALRTVVQDPGLSDTFRALFAAELRACTVGWPRRAVRGAITPAWLRQGDVLVELARSPAAEALTLGLSLHADGATRLTDALLGARVSSRLASAAGQPSEAECGLLAYAVARLLASHGADWIVRDVRRTDLAPCVSDLTLVWPVSVDSSLGPIEAALWLSESMSDSGSERHALEVVLFEHLESNAPEPELTTGDVWISDHLALTNTSDGLTGQVTLQVPGCATQLDAFLHKDHVRVSGVRLGPRVTRRSLPTSGLPIELVIARSASSLRELGDLAEGARHFVGRVGQEPVLLRRAEQVLAQGELITWRGALGVRITQA